MGFGVRERPICPNTKTVRPAVVLVSKSRKMTLTLQARAILDKTFYQNGDSATEALRKFWFLKRLQKGPLSSQGLTNMIRKFKATGTLGVQPGRRRKCVAVQVVDDEATQVEEDRSQTIGSTSFRRIAASVVQPRSTVHKILRKARRCDTTTVFMLGRVPPHIARCVKQVLHHHFGGNRIINRNFPTAWPPRSLDLNLCRFIPQSHGLP
ncbi:uncharacterized protein TNCV_3597221 [Trichonephila clavipes]|nr:uncharacterized protein TNCV_3597221 [Trichonephila clavipes]